MTNKDSFHTMLAAVQAFHDKHDFKNTGGEELAYRVALMTEELGEISSCVTKGKDTHLLAEECADLLILLADMVIFESGGKYSGQCASLCPGFGHEMETFVTHGNVAQAY